MTTLLAIRPGALGDTLLTLPTLRGLRAGFPGARLHLVAHPGGASVLQATGEIDGYTDFDASELVGLFSATGPPSALERLRPLAAVVAWLSDPDGTVRSNLEYLAPGRLLVAPSRPAAGSKQHAADHLLATLQPWGLPRPYRGPLILPQQGGAPDRLRADLLVHPGSGAQAKNWPPESFARVVNDLSRGEASVALVCGPADESACASVLAYVKTGVRAVRPASVLELAETLASARAYLGNDSGVTHLAACLGVPTVALFGPTDPSAWGPRGSHVRLLGFDAAPGEVVNAVRRLAAQPGGRLG